MNNDEINVEQHVLKLINLQTRTSFFDVIKRKNKPINGIIDVIIRGLNISNIEAIFQFESRLIRTTNFTLIKLQSIIIIFVLNYT